MSEVDMTGGADAPAAIDAAVINPADANDSPPPLGSQIPESDVREAERIAKAEAEAKTAEAEKAAEEKAKAEKPKKEPSKSVDEAVEKALAKMKAKEATPERDATGKFLPKEGKEAEPGADVGKAGEKPAQEPAKAAEQPKELTAEQQAEQDKAKTRWEAPSRFNADAKQAWETAPDPVKAEVHRAIRELETGIEEHRARWEPIKQYDEMARQYETDLPSALERYVSMDKLLSQDLTQGLDSIIRDKTGGQMGLREVVAQLTGQKPDAVQSQQDATTHQLRQEITGLKQQLGSVAQVLQKQAASQTQEQVTAFAADKPDFDALSPRIAEHIRKGQDLPAAYQAARQEAEEMARSLGFVPAAPQPVIPASQQPVSPAPQPKPLNPAGQKSVSGSPSSGSQSPARKKGPLPSIDDTLTRIGL